MIKNLVYSSCAALVALLPLNAASETDQADEDVVILPHRILDTIDIYGDRKADDAGSLNHVSFDIIDDIKADHPAEILNTVPGVNIHMNSGQEHLIGLRSPVLTGGAGQGSFLILENGVPTRSPGFGNVNSLFEVHHELADSIEIVKGPASAAYGSNAVHGLINFGHASTSKTDTSLHFNAGTLERYRADGHWSPNSDGGNTHLLSLSLAHDSGWRNDSGHDQQKLTYQYKNSDFVWPVHAWLTLSNLDQETAGFITGFEAYNDKNTAKINPNPEAFRQAYSIRGAARFETQLENGTVSVTPFARYQRMKFLQHFLPYDGLEKNGHEAFGMQVRYEQDAGYDLLWRVGGDMDFANGYLKETQSRASFGPFPQGTHYDYEVKSRMVAIFAEIDWQINDSWVFEAGLRGETHNYDYTTNTPPGINGRFQVTPDRDDSFTLFTPKLGLSYVTENGHFLFARYARGERAPQISDLYRLQALQLPGDADTETLDSFEIGARGEIEFGVYTSYQLAAYHMEKDNFFFRDSNGLNVTDGKTRHIGIEAEIYSDLNNNWNFGLSAAYGKHTYEFDRPVASPTNTITSGDFVDTAPKWLLDGHIEWQNSNEEWRARLSAEYISEYYTDPSNTHEYEGHLVAHARIGWTPQKASHDIEVYANIRNLFDKRYADRADFGFGSHRYFPGEPLNLTIGVRKTF